MLQYSNQKASLQYQCEGWAYLQDKGSTSFCQNEKWKLSNDSSQVGKMWFPKQTFSKAKCVALSYICGLHEVVENLMQGYEFPMQNCSACDMYVAPSILVVENMWRDTLTPRRTEMKCVRTERLSSWAMQPITSLHKQAARDDLVAWQPSMYLTSLRPVTTRGARLSALASHLSPLTSHAMPSQQPTVS